MKRSFLVSLTLTTVLVSGLALAQTQPQSQNQNQDSEMANVEAVMQRAHQVQQQQRADQQQQQAAQKAGANFMQNIIKSSQNDAKQQLVTPGTNTTPAPTTTTQSTTPATTPTATATAANGAQVQRLESQLSQLNQANRTFQQQTDQRIDVLNQEHNVLQNKLAQLNQVLGILNQEVTQLSQQITTAQKQLNTNLTPQQRQHMASMTENFASSINSSKTIHYVLYAILVLLVIIIMMLIPRRGGYKIQTVTEGAPASSGKAANESAQNDTEDEYDFMNSDEAIPAKLDLARAYLAMEDYKSARKVLDQVMKNGNAEQRAQAQKMLDKIPQ